MVPQVLLPPKLVPVFSGEAMFRGAYGGRGSTKTRSFAKMAAVRALMWATEGREGIVFCGREFAALAPCSRSHHSAVLGKFTAWYRRISSADRTCPTP